VSRTPDRFAAGAAALLCAAALGWAVVLPLAPVSIAAAPDVAWVPYALGRLVCHQQPDRSFVTAGVQWPVCGRCAGLYLSGAAGILAVLALPLAVRPPMAAPDVWRVLLVAAALPTLVSWGAERFDWWRFTSAARALLALPLGLATGALVASIARPGRSDERGT
jgi:uncharacterized membrane protein